MKTIIAKNNWFVDSDLRLDASFHLSEGNITKKYIQNSPYPINRIGYYSGHIFYGGRAKRYYVTNKEKGIPFIGSSDMLKSDLSNLKYISKKLTTRLENYLLKEGWTLVSRSGTVGNTAFTNKCFEGKAASEHIIRVVPNSRIKSGFLYAYLSSKYGYSLLTQGIFGAVIQHIEPEYIANIPIPIFPSQKQEKIHNLIVEAAELRVEGNRLLAEAHEMLCKILKFDDIVQKSSEVISVKDIANSFNARFEGNYYISEGCQIQQQLISKYNCKPLKEVASNIFRPGIFKRHYVSNGITFLGGSDITKANPDSDKKLSKKKTPGINSLMLKKHWILCTCGGTIGNMAYVDKQMEQCAASQHILRIIPSNIKSGYLYAFLSSKIGNSMITNYAFGSVIPQVEPQHIEQIPIPIIDDKIEQQIHEMVMMHVDNMEIAKQKESEAIHLIEKEINSWQQS